MFERIGGTLVEKGIIGKGGGLTSRVKGSVMARLCRLDWIRSRVTKTGSKVY